jgi:DNA invertase Pin-like site-specific DNA recombinase
MPAMIGYARTSTLDQNLNLQLDALAGVCLKIFSEQASGANTTRPQLGAALAFLRPGDTLVVWKLDRLGRTVRHLCELFAQLEADGIHFRSLTEGIDTSTPAGRLYFHLAAAFAQMERELTIERIRAGQAATRARGGSLGGRRRLLSQKKLDAARVLFAQGLRGREIAATLGCSVPTLYRHLPASERQINFALESAFPRLEPSL